MEEAARSQDFVVEYISGSHDASTRTNISGLDSDFNQNTANIDPTSVSVDQMINDVGGFGIYQVFLTLLFSLANIPATYQVLLMYFTGHSPSWRCRNGTGSLCSYVGEITASDEHFHARCSMPRDDWEYVTAKSFSIITEFDLVCDKNSVAAFGNSALYIGWGIGCIPLGMAADRFGRKPIMFFSGALILSSVLASAFITSVWQFIVLRAFTGIGITGYGLSAYVLASEIVGTRFRSTVGSTIFFFGTGALLLLTLQAYYIRNWRHLTIICSAPYFAFAIFFLCVSESPRWLSSQGKISQAMKTLTNIARINRKPRPKSLLEANSEVRKTQGTFANLFKPRRRLKITSTLSFGWMVAGLGYYGISLASADLSGNMYRDFALTSLVEVPATLVAIPCLEKLGRSRTTVVSMILGGISCCLIAFLPEKSPTSFYPIMRVVGGMVGKFFISLAFSGLYVWSIELHPTTIRTQGMSFASLLARVGSSTAPFIADVLKEVHPALPFLVIGCMSLLAGFACLVLPETKGESTVEVVDDSCSAERRVTRNTIQMESITQVFEENYELSDEEFDDAGDDDALIRKPKIIRKKHGLLK